MKRISVVLALFLLTACGDEGRSEHSLTPVKYYEGSDPKLDMREFLNGEIEGHGLYIDRNANAKLRFTIAVKGSFIGDDGTVTEDFVYNDGRLKHREWTIHFTDEHNFTAKASDVPNIAKGEQYGNTAGMKYSLFLEDKNMEVDIDSTAYLIDCNTVINRADVRKFGVRAGQIMISFRKKTDSAGNAVTCGVIPPNATEEPLIPAPQAEPEAEPAAE